MIPEIQYNESAFMELLRDVPIDTIPDLPRTDPERSAALKQAADNEIAAFDERVATVKSIKAPPAMLTYHRSLIQYLRGMQQQYRLLKDISRDPVQGLLSLQLLHTLSFETSAQLIDSFTREYSNVLQ